MYILFCVYYAASGLNIYSMLAPNAYSQLKAKVVHSPDTHAIIPSVVYDVSSQYTNNEVFFQTQFNINFVVLHALADMIS